MVARRTHVVNHIAYSGIARPKTTNCTVAREDDRKTKSAVVAWLVSADMPSSKRSGPMTMPPPMPKNPPRKPATNESNGYNHKVRGVHARTPSAESVPLAFWAIVVAPALVKTVQRTSNPPNCIQYIREHCGALTMLDAKNTTQQPTMRAMARVLSFASSKKVGMSTILNLIALPPFDGRRTWPAPPPPPPPTSLAAPWRCSSNNLVSFLYCWTPFVNDFCSARTRVAISTSTMIHCGVIRFSMTPRVTPAASPGFSITMTS
mmetsp:Transcript_24491/g.68808  ORF Transcript_24491/g.68808 Transcript_24491/m.68808 type:complete len:262 (-) Transcript_24491:204-989(-)